MPDALQPFWSWLAGLLVLALAAVAAGHAVLRKRDVRASIGWVGLILVFPVAGALLYAVFGVNRIRRQARLLRPRPPAGAGLGDGASPGPRRLRSLARLGGQVTHLPLTAGNLVEPLVDGEEAFPPMLEAIRSAERSISLETYIFDHDETGRRFQDALAAAVRRGVEVRVIVDAAGRRYSWPTPVKALQDRGVPAAAFLPTHLPWRLHFLNLRTHRKILVVDGRLAFTGGINLRHEHLVRGSTRKPVQDLHFRVQGPVVEQLQRVFATDWTFCRKEDLEGEEWFPAAAVAPSGESLARAIPDGPDEDLDGLYLTLLAGLGAARERILVVTPYFLPDRPLATAFFLAALRGVEVDILLPARNNIPPVQWAGMPVLEELVQHGCRVWLTPPPFDHSKLLVIDGEWALVGSANLDPRSLRLNFELNLEVYDGTFGRRLEEIGRAKRHGAFPVTLEWLRGRPLPLRLRDGIARLASPYL